MSAACTRCGAPASLELASGQEATVGSVAGALLQVPRFHCAEGHDLAAGAHPGIADAALTLLREQVPFARTRRLRRGDACSVCGESLSMPVRRTDWPVTLERPAEVPAVLTLRLDVPATRCPGCGTDHVPSRSQADLEATVLALFAAGTDGTGTS